MDRKPVKSAVRALEVLEIFAQFKKPLTLKEIIVELGYPQSSATFLLKSLVVLGYLNYNLYSRTYFPTMKLTAVSKWMGEPLAEQAPVYWLMTELQKRTQETVAIGVQNDISLHFLAVKESTQEIRFHVPEGGMRPLLRSNLGWLLLSRLDQRQIENIYRKIKVREPKLARSYPYAKFVKQIEIICHQDYCYIPNIPTRGAGSIAMMLPSYFHEQPMVVAVGGHITRLERKSSSILVAMRACIAEFSDRAGLTHLANSAPQLDARLLDPQEARPALNPAVRRRGSSQRRADSRQAGRRGLRAPSRRSQ